MIFSSLDRYSRSPRKALATDHPPHIPVAGCLHALEPRHMFDAAGVATGAEAAVDTVAQEQAEHAVDSHFNASDASDAHDPLLEALAAHEPPAGRREVVFIDTSVEDYQKLIAGIDPSAEVVLLEATRDGLEQMAEVLTGRSGIDAIHIVSHGSQAELRLGTARLTIDSMTGQYVDELAVLGEALTDEADLLMYGCDFGQGPLGQEAATTLAEITGADVAASEDATGHATLGGDWNLEFRAGSVETTAVLSLEAQANFMGLLAPPSIDLDANDSSGTPGTDYSAQYPAAGGNLPITDIDARLVDADSATLSSLTVTLANPLDGANESLSANTTGTAITASYDSPTGALTLAGVDTVGNYQRVLRTVAYENSAGVPNRTDRSITFVANDGAGDSNVGTATVYWNYVRDDFAPAAYDGNDGSDSWSTDWQEIGESNGPASGRVQVASGSLEISTLLAGLGMRGAAREVNLSGASSAVLSFNYQRSSGLISSSQAFAEVSNNGGGSWFRLATYDLNSSDATPIAQQFDLTPYISSQTQIRFASNTLSLELLASSISFDDIDISYDAHGSTPILDLDSGAPGANFATTFTEGAGPVVVADTDAVVTDADSPMLTELVATIVNPQDGAAESLAANTGATGITASYDPATATLTLSGNDTVANYQQVLRTISYDNTSQSPNTAARTITFQASDGIDHSNVAFTTVTVNAVNDPPVVATTGSALAYTENDPALAVDSGLTVSDVDNTTLTGATVTLSANYVNGEDVLGFTDQLGIGGIWNAATGTLTLTGTTTLANYQAALRTITYTNTSDGPSTLARTVSFVVNDGAANSAATTRTLNIIAVNDAPVITSNGGGATATVNVTENATAVTIVSSSDVDGGAPIYSLIGGADQGLFAIDPSTGALGFNAAPDFEMPADAGANNVYNVTVQVSDSNGGTDTQAIAVTITDVNEPPVVNDQAFSVAENTANGTPVGSVIASDVDAGDTRSFSITAGNTGGAFAIDNAGVITVASTAALDFETNPSFTLTVQVQDAGGLTDTATVTVNLTNVNDAPVITSNGGGASASLSIAENATAVTTVTATDADLPAQSLTYNLIGGPDAALFSVNATTGALSFNTAPNFEAPADAGANNVYDVTVQVSDGNGGTDTQALSVTVIAAAPTGPAPPSTGIPEGSPSAPAPEPSSGDPVAVSRSEVDDGNSSKIGFERNMTASDDSRVTTSASSTRAPVVSSKELGSDKNFIDGTSRLGSKQPIAKETNAAAASATDVQDVKGPYSTLNVNLEELDRLRDNMNHQLSLETLALSLGLSVGYAIWLVRGGALLSSLLSSLPAWRWLDPLPVLAHLRDTRDEGEENGDSLQTLLKSAEARDRSRPISDVEVVPPAQQAATGATLLQPDATPSLQEEAQVSV